VPAPTPLAENDVAVLPVEKLTRFAVPGSDPASMTNEMVASTAGGPTHVSVTELPLIFAMRLLGASGNPPAT
jgi:hypothetical protein